MENFRTKNPPTNSLTGFCFQKATCGHNDKACSSIAAAYYAGVVAAPAAKQTYDDGQNHRRRHCSGQNISERVTDTAKNTVSMSKKAVVKAGSTIVNSTKKAGKKLIDKIGGIFN